MSRPYPTVECDDCAWRGTHADLNDVDPYTLWERLDENGPMPAGECPTCGALAYLITQDEWEVSFNG